MGYAAQLTTKRDRDEYFRSLNGDLTIDLISDSSIDIIKSRISALLTIINAITLEKKPNPRSLIAFVAKSDIDQLKAENEKPTADVFRQYAIDTNNDGLHAIIVAVEEGDIQTIIRIMFDLIRLLPALGTASINLDLSEF